MHPDFVVDAGVDAGVRFINVPTTQRYQANSELAQFRFDKADGRLPFETYTSVSPDFPAAVDEDVGDCGISEQRMELPEVCAASSTGGSRRCRGFRRTGSLNDEGCRVRFERHGSTVFTLKTHPVDWAGSVDCEPRDAMWTGGKPHPGTSRANPVISAANPGTSPEKERGGAYWGEQAPPRQRGIGGNHVRCQSNVTSTNTVYRTAPKAQ